MEAGIAEPLLAFALIMVYIWKLRVTHPSFWLFPVAFIAGSHVARRERARTLGFELRNFGKCVRDFGPLLIGMVLAMWGAGLVFGSIRPLGPGAAFLAFAIYVPWGLFQQYLLNAYFLKRFEMSLSRQWAAILAAALFGVVHSPNWFLMVVTPVGALGAIWVYRRYGNLYFPGLAHAALGFTLFMVVPDSVTHHLRIGPGWYTGQ